MATLKVLRSEAAHILGAHRAEGKRVLELATDEGGAPLQDYESYLEWTRERSRWRKRTTNALGYVYGGSQTANEFEQAASSATYVGGSEVWPQDFEAAYLAVEDAISFLQALAESLRYDDEPVPPSDVTQSEAANAPLHTGPPVIFLVHGHDDTSRDTVRSFLERAGNHKHDIVILDEKASKGQTIVEKLEEHASASQYAVVLLTGDDICSQVGRERVKHLRARQNVILELGWFCGAIGRDHVAVLYETAVELPSDISGLVYIPLDGDWEKRLARELKAAHFDFSLDRL